MVRMNEKYRELTKKYNEEIHYADKVNKTDTEARQIVIMVRNTERNERENCMERRRMQDTEVLKKSKNDRGLSAKRIQHSDEIKQWNRN